MLLPGQKMCLMSREFVGQEKSGEEGLLRHLAREEVIL